MENGIPEVVLGKLDYIVMAAYMLGLLGLGLYYRKFAQEDMENYFLGGRKLPGWLSGVSMATTCMNADVAPAYCGMTVITGVFVCWWYLSRFGLALMIAAVLFAVFWRRLKLFTGPEFYELRFSGGAALTMRSWVAIRSAMFVCAIWCGAGLLGLHKVSYALLGWEKWQTFAVIIPVILTYVFLSGYMGVVVSDLIQGIIMILSSLVLMTMVLIDFGGPSGLYTALVENFGPSVVSWHPPSSHELLGVIGVVAWTVGTAVGYGGDITPMNSVMEGQRLLSCKNARQASKMYIWTEVVLFLLLAVLTLPALGAMVKWPGLRDGTINKELAYGILLGHYLPTGLLGLAIIAIFASIMASVDSNLNFGSQVFINDIYRRLIVKKASMKHYMNVGRVMMFVIMALAILVATKAKNVIDIAVFMLGLYSAEFTANWGQWWWWRFNGKARLAASFGGPFIFLMNKFVIFEYLINAGVNTAYIVVLSSIAMTCVLWVLVALFTKPDPEEKLVEFYKRARPLGWWGPIALKATGQTQAQVSHRSPIFAGLLVAFLGTVTTSAGVIALSCAYIGRWTVATIAVSISVVAGVLFKIGYGKFMTYIDARE